MVEMLFGRGLVKVSFALFGLRGSRIIWCLDRTNMAVGVFLLAATHFQTTNVDGTVPDWIEDFVEIRTKNILIEKRIR